MKGKRADHRFRRTQAPSLQNWKRVHQPDARKMKNDVTIECGWGRLVFGHTFADNKEIARVMCEERRGQRDIAFYLRDPHVVLALAPQQLFLDPSHTYRLWLDTYRPARVRPQGFIVRRLREPADTESINAVLARCHMIQVDQQMVWKARNSRTLTYFVAEDTTTGEVIGTVCGVDHRYAFNDPENGSSLWSLAVDPNCLHSGVGESLTRHLAEHFQARGRHFMDLSVLHDNELAIGLYEKKLGFQRVPVFSIKHKNPINEPLFIAPPPEAGLNPYAAIIVKEARRRGIDVDIVDEDAGYFRLRFGGRSIVCRESLSELTSAVAMSRCDDKRITSRLLHKSGLKVPAQRLAGRKADNHAFLKEHQRVVVKPARGEQGQGVFVDIRTAADLDRAIKEAKVLSQDVILEQMVEGRDLRLIVIDFKLVAASVRRPPQVVGTGKHTLQQLIRKQNRRRMAATGGESKITVDEEVSRCLKNQGYTLDSTPPEGEVIQVRKTANLHTGGTIHDVTPHLNPKLAEVAVKAAQVLNIPVVGLDLIVRDESQDDYYIIEANERPGLANHEPQPTAERFIDLLFPQTVSPQPEEETFDSATGKTSRPGDWIDKTAN